ncbi:MAG: hypothetical protein ABFQ53_00340 [Patescibacteria group bacterium]
MLKTYFTPKKKDLVQYTLTIVIISLLFTPLYLFYPHLEAAFTNEGMFMEALAVFLYAYCTLKAGKIAFIANNAYTRGVGVLLFAFSLLWLLEETSFGHNIIYRYDRPEIYGTKVDTVHDLLHVLKHLITTQPTSLVTILSLVCIITIIASIVWLSMKNKATSYKFLASSSALFLIITITLLLIAGLIDLDLFEKNTGARFFVFCEELLELAAAISMVFAVRIFYKERFDVIEKK